VLTSWDEAIQHCASDRWQHLQLEASNQYRERLLERDRSEYLKWNEIVGALKLVTIPFVDARLAILARQENLPSVFRDMVQWDILGVCWEAEFSHVCEPGWYAGNAFWYMNGHFPCGWLGELPGGRPIIY